MAETKVLHNDEQDAGIEHPLWLFLNALSGVNNELERARLIATAVPSLIPCQISGVVIIDSVGKRWQPVFQKDGRPLAKADTDRMLVELEPSLDAAFSQAPVLVCETSDAKLWQFMVELGVRHLAAAPLMTVKTRLGVLFVGRDAIEPFSRDEEQILATIAEHSAIGIENLRLHRDLQQYTRQRHRGLLEVNNAIIANLDRTSLLNAISKALGQIFSPERVSLVLYDPGKDLLRVHAEAGTSDSEMSVGVEFPLKGSHLERVFTTQQPLLCNDLEKEARFTMEESLLRAGIRSYVAIPLISKARAFGCLNIGSRERHRYSETEVDFLLEVGQQVSLAVENMLAYEEIAQLKSQLEQENVYLQEEIKTEHNFDEILGQSFAIRQVLDTVSTVAPTPATVLITGETGTGKELIARAVHSLSTRQNKPLIKVNCAAIPKELFESEFFGHVKGAFTGAVKDRQGRFELADGGTLFLDEVAEIPLELQSKLLRVLQEEEFERIGEQRTRSIDVRIIAASNRDLEEEIQAGRFRQDLYFRLNVVPIEVPPLRERRDDIVLLANHFLARACQRFGRHRFELTERQIESLKQYDWLGNVRELCNVIDRAVILSKGRALGLEQVLHRAHGRSAPATDVGSDHKLMTAEEFELLERDNILLALEQAGGRISGPGGAAALLCLAPSTLANRMKKLGVARPN